MLKELPEGYVLWERVKVDTKRSGQPKKGNEPAGAVLRQDAYLYGHPDGRLKRFRSPAEFLPHLLWLATDKEGDTANCSCRFCSLDGDLPDPIKDAKKDATPTATTKSTTSIRSTTSIPVPPSKASIPTTKEIIEPVPIPPPRPQEIAYDSEASSKFIYRPGELVWFENGTNWRLGVISKRGLLNGRPRYMLQPLSNPFQHQTYQIKDQESSLRPWLAWSVPDTTVPALKNLVYDQVPWERVIRGDFNQNQVQDYVVDGSILAAKSIDASYSLFDRNETALAGPGEVHYKGMFLGAEKIWVGEPVRLKAPNQEIVVLIIQKLIERTTPPPNVASSVIFVGDVYKFVEMPMPYKNRDEWPTPNLPPRMIVDLRFRNEVADMVKKGVWYEWRLLEPAARKGLSDIKGRWYETRTLLPILRGEQTYQADLQRGNTSDAGQWMNSRKDNNTNPETRKKNRRDTVGRAVPDTFKVSRGLDGPPADDLFPDQIQQPAPPKVGSDMQAFEQFLNLEPAGFRKEQDVYGAQFR